MIGLNQQVLVSGFNGISVGCVDPHDVTPDHPARARVAEGEDGNVTPDVLRAHVVALTSCSTRVREMTAASL